MKNLYLSFILLICISGLMAIQVSGNQSGIWTAENNPYEVVGAISVPNGSNLEIQAGVLVHIMGNFQITVAGTMHAMGTAADSIRFINMQANPTALWSGLRMENISQASELNHVYVEYGTYGVRCMNAPLTVRNSRFNLCEKGMELYAIGAANPANVLVEYNLIENCIQNGILISQNSNAVIEHNEIRFNGTGAQFRAAIQLSNQSAGGSNNPIIAFNHIHHNFKQGISAWDVASSGAINPQILNNVISYNYTGVYLLQTSGYVADNEISYNFIPGDMNSGAGVMVSGITSEPYFERNTVIGNYTGFYITNNAKPVLGDLTIFHAWAQGENIIAENIDANGVVHSVFCDAYPTAAFIIKAENNNWGAFTPADIAVGINDHNDNAALPTVDFEPFISPVSPTVVTGSYVYSGTAPILSARLELISMVTNAILFVIPLTETSFSTQAPLTEAFSAQVVLTRQDNGAFLYGCTGGYASPTIFYPGDFVPVDVGIIQVQDQMPPRYELMGVPVTDGILVLHPLMSGFGIYSWDKIDWLYANGDYLYLKKHTIRVDGYETFIDLPENTVWKKYQNIQPGDSWQQTEVMDVSGTLRVSTTTVQECSIDVDNVAYQLFIRKTASGSVIDKTIVAPGESILFTYENNYTKTTEAVLRYGNPDPLGEGAFWRFNVQSPNFNPSYLAYVPVPYPNMQVQLHWQAPAMHFNNWTHYRVYRNMDLLAEIPFAQSEYLDLTYNPSITGTTSYLVCAWDGSVESERTNWVTVVILSNNDQVLQPVSVSLYPNPVAFSQQQNLEFCFQNLKNQSAE
ncbi:MAG: right-handed parallel beta-helix repeat-containing protein, partial [Candidatus Cloacimonas sp.]|nr:right-handed parallel beta-helix repeat-containing protein [Candidatus Cloacimonas sp.]